MLTKAELCSVRRTQVESTKLPRRIEMRPFYRLVVVVLSVLLYWGVLSLPNRADGQNAPQQVVVDGGILIDGNGGAPVRDAQIVIQGNRISKIGKKGDTIASGAQVIRA